MNGDTDDTGETARVDQWTWAVRLFPTRSAAAASCRSGHVKVNGSTAKPSTTVRAGDRVEVRLDHRLREVVVEQVIRKRVGAPVAAACYVDHSPPPPPREHEVQGYRPRGSGRPTKRDRRALDRLRGRRR